MSVEQSWCLSWLLGYEARRKRLLKKAPQGPLRDFLSVPFPKSQSLLADTPILSVDFETTGLNPQQDKLLSVGFVELQKSQINLASCYHQIIQSKGALNAENVSIHHITDSEKNQGKSLSTVVEMLLQALAGKVMLVHFSRIETQFLSQACLELYGMAPVFPVIDTLLIAKRRFDQHDVAYDPSQLRLSALRKRYKLSEHFAHNALNDAIATAELLLAQTTQVPFTQQAKLSSVLL